MNRVIAFYINVDWYLRLHWVDRLLSLKEQGFQVVIITNFTSNNNKSYLEALGFKVFDLNLRRKSLNPITELGVLFKTYSIIKRINPDIIHSVTIKPNIYGGLVGLHLGIPVISSITGLGLVFSSNKSWFKIVRTLVCILYKKVSTSKTKFIFENESDYQTFKLLNLLDDNGVVIKGAGVDLSKYNYKPPVGSRGILFAARLLKDKGLDTLIDAVEKYRYDGGVCELNVAGIVDDDAKSAIPMHEIESLDKRGVINWLGTIDNMTPVIHANDIVCLPTKYGEGVPRILIEGAACGRALIATNTAGCNEIIQDNVNGCLIDVDDDTSLYQTLSAMLDNAELLKEYGVCGRKIVESEYSQSIVIAKTLSVYKSMLT